MEIETARKKDRVIMFPRLVPELVLFVFLIVMLFGGQAVTAHEGEIHTTETSPSANSPADVKEPAKPSHFVDNQDGTVTDKKNGLMWTRKDSYQDLKKWLNWFMSQDYIKELNEKKFAGYDDWRFPNRKEAGTLFDENQTIEWKYYWTTNELHMDPVFVDPHCCLWTSEANKDIYAWGFNYIRGKPYLSKKDTGVQYSLTAIRPVRDIKK